MPWFWSIGLIASSVIGPWFLYRACTRRPPARPPWRSDVGWYVLVVAAAVALAVRDAVIGTEIPLVERWAKGEISGFLIAAFAVRTVRWRLARHPLTLPVPDASAPRVLAAEAD